MYVEQSKLLQNKTRSSATADRPRDALCQSVSCQLLHSCRHKLYSKSTTNRINGVRGLQLIDCSKQPRLVDCRIGVVNKLDRRRVCWQRDRLAVEENSRVTCVYLYRYPIFYRAILCIRLLVMAVCLSVRPSVCPSQVGVLLNRLNVGSRKQHHTIAQWL